MTRKNTNAQRKGRGRTRTRSARRMRREPRAKSAARNRKPIAPELESLSTERIWELYLKARKAGPKAADALEKLRNALMERYYPLVRYIADRLLQTLPKSIELDDLVSAGPVRPDGRDPRLRPRSEHKVQDVLHDAQSADRSSISLRSAGLGAETRAAQGRADRESLQRLTGEYGREPTHAELASDLDLQHDELSIEMQSASAKTMFSLSDKWEDRDEDSGIEKVDVLEEPEIGRPDR